MKILWLSNRVLTDAPTASTGSWLQAMSKALTQTADIELYNITTGNSDKFVRNDCGSIKQWQTPKIRLKDGLPSQHIIEGLCKLIDEIAPDLIHIWGMEVFWGLLSSRKYITAYPVILEIQGLRYTCAEAYMGGLTQQEISSCIRLRDWFVPRRRIDKIQAVHRGWGKYEKEMLGAHHYISTQSQWVRASIAPYCSHDVKIFETLMAVRDQFMTSTPWNKSFAKQPIQLLSVATGAIPYKGVHVAIRALAVLKQYYPDITLKIVGNYQQTRKDVHKHGYVKFLERLIDENDLRKNVVFVGSLTTPDLVQAMQEAHIMLHTSHVETYSLALAEAMAVGIPGVISYAGALPELAQDGITGLFYSPNDFRQCAYQVRRLIEEPQLAHNISVASREIAMMRNDIDSVTTRQIEIYNQVIEEGRRRE